MTPLNLAFVDDHPTLLRGLATLFDSDAYRIVGSGTCATDLLRLAQDAGANVIVVDLSMPGDVFDAIARVTAAHGTQIIVFTAYANTEFALRALEAGAHAFVLKGRPSEDLFDAIKAVAAGELFVSPDFAPKIISAVRNRAQREEQLKAATLSVRERQIIACLLRGQTNKEIARELDLSEKTIKHYMTNLMVKLKAKNRLEVVLAVQSHQDGRSPPAVAMLETQA